ncbi:unnamed protein product [Schistosoma turkestanicum]|nr:unnamed protein product [Schistosoma turkestanicum]
MVYNQNGIINVSVEFIMANITTTLFEQFHTIQFIEEKNRLPNTIALTMDLNYLSGNPGYLNNYPIRAGYIENVNTTTTINTTRTTTTTTANPYIVMKSYPTANPTIHLNENGRMNFGWWPIPNAGDCTEYTNPLNTILFGRNIFTSCILRLKPWQEYNYTNCDPLEQVIRLLLNLNKPPITHIGIWGNADNKRMTDWIKLDIVDAKQNNKIVFSNGTKSW